jgi:hypothetical protein
MQASSLDVRQQELASGRQLSWAIEITIPQASFLGGHGAQIGDYRVEIICSEGRTGASIYAQSTPAISCAAELTAPIVAAIVA